MRSTFCKSHTGGWGGSGVSVPAELRIPVQAVNVEEHGATGVGDVCAVHPPVLAPRQALRGNTNRSECVQRGPVVSRVLIYTSGRTQDSRTGSSPEPLRCQPQETGPLSHPDDPGVHGAKHGSLTAHGQAHLLHVVQQPAQLHGAEVGADGEARLGLERDSDSKAG